jgi:hypothetical protein
MVLSGDRLGVVVTSSGHEPGTRTRSGIGHSKMMSTIVWNPNGFHLIDAMPKREKYTARYDIDNIPTPIFQRLIPAGERKSIIHADDSRCHTAKFVLDFVSQKDQIRPAFPYSPHIILSELFLFAS